MDNKKKSIFIDIKNEVQGEIQPVSYFREDFKKKYNDMKKCAMIMKETLNI